jgi:aspartate racemase
MTDAREKILGIVGGMGPESTIDLMQQILAATAAACDQDHVHVLADSNPKIPDRTAFLLGRGPSPIPAIRESLRRLNDAGADLILIPCNTAHAFFDELQTACPVPILNMVELCADHARAVCGAGGKAGLLATTGTVRSGVYDRALRDQRVAPVVPNEPEQEELMEWIYGGDGIKAGHRAEQAAPMAELGRRLIERGAKAVVAGCTEVGLVLREPGYPVINPIRLLAEEAVRQVKGGG